MTARWSLGRSTARPPSSARAASCPRQRAPTSGLGNRGRALRISGSLETISGSPRSTCLDDGWVLIALDQRWADAATQTALELGIDLTSAYFSEPADRRSRMRSVRHRSQRRVADSP